MVLEMVNGVRDSKLCTNLLGIQNGKCVVPVGTVNGVYTTELTSMLQLIDNNWFTAKTFPGKLVL